MSDNKAAKVTSIAPPQYIKIPQELIEIDAWINFSSEWDDKQSKWTKPPCNSSGSLLSGGFKSTTNYEAVKRAQMKNPDSVKGIGFSFANSDGGIIGIDFDHVIDGEGNILPEVTALLTELNSYTEVSISGDGLHTFVGVDSPVSGGKGKLIFKNAFGPGTGMEIFVSTGYLTVSGKRLDQYGTTVKKKCTTKVKSIIRTYEKERVISAVRAITEATSEPLFAEVQEFSREFESRTGIKIVRSTERDNGSYMLALTQCPWGGGADTEGTHHDDGPNDAVIFFTPGQRPVFYCFHTTCEGRTWDDVCDKYTELPRGNYIDRYNSDFCIVSHGREVYVARDGTGTREDKLGTAKKVKTFIEERAWDRVTIQNNVGEDKTICLAKAWSESKHARRYERGFVFAPGETAPAGTLNLWNGFEMEASPKGCCDLFNEHWKNMICGGDEEIYKWMRMWFADIIQNPGKTPAGTSIIVKGKQGMGKSLLAETFGKIIGNDYFTQTARTDELSGKFNSHVVQSVLVLGDEITFKGDKVNHNRLKGIITSRIRNLEAKHKDAVKIPSISRYYLTTNADFAIPAERTERRFLILRVEGKKPPRDYFERIIAQLEDGGYERLMYEMQQVQMDRSALRDAPITDELIDEKQAALTGVEKFIDHLISEPELPEEANGENEGKFGWPKVTSFYALYTLYRRMSREWGERENNILTKRLFLKELRAEFAEMGFPLEQVTKSNKDNRCYFPSHAEVEEAWGIRVKHG